MWHNEDSVDTITFAEFRMQAHANAANFTAQGVRRGDIIILIMPQGIPLMATFVGAMLVGAVPAILAYPNFKVEPAKYRSGLRGVTTNLKAKWVVIDDEFPSEWIEYVKLDQGAQLLRSCSDSNIGTEPLLYVSAKSDDLAFIQHSAGTTGLQKGVALSHAAVLRQLDHLGTVLKLDHQDCIYSWLPLYHDMGLIACFILPLVYHLPVIMQSPTDWVMQPVSMLQLITQHHATIAWTPNFGLQFLARRVHRDDREGLDLSSLRLLINCSEPVRSRSIDEFVDAYSPAGLKANALQSSYAMAENVFAVTQSRLGSQPGRVWIDGQRLRDDHKAVEIDSTSPIACCFVSSGSLLPGNEIRIVSEDGNDVPSGIVGEILIRSDSLFDGYHNRADLTEEAVRSGWYWSGDLGFLLHGELFVIGRKKDLIIVGGKNIYPQDIEEIVCGHVDIHDGRAVSLGLFNDKLGTEDIVIIAEVEREEALGNSLAIEQAVRLAIVSELGVAVRAVYLKPPRWIVKSTAGKPARGNNKTKLLAEHPELSRDQLEWELN
jgi:fatty-acyl-CoA synthase